MKFCIAGSGYVGLSLAVMISQKYEVNLLDIDQLKISTLKNKKSPLAEKKIKEFLSAKDLKLYPTLDPEEAIKDADYTIIATPTNYDNVSGSFDTSSVELILNQCQKYNPKSYIVIKSTVPVGFTDQMRARYKSTDIAFSPEFLREGSALEDNLNPSRIIIGDSSKKAEKFINVLLECSEIRDASKKIFYMNSSEAEATKLFSNTYLAMRVSFFNELDSFSKHHNLSTRKIITGVCSDERIGNYYNNPSFGYGGYCLPKDTKQLSKQFNKIPNKLIQAIIESNETRKKFIVKSILEKNPKSVGIYRINMKLNSDNYRESSVLNIIKKLEENKVIIYVYEPQIKSISDKYNVIEDIREFAEKSDLIIANRLSNEINFAKNKIFTRDIFGEN